MSAEIMRKRNSYYEILQKVTTGDLCITDWLLWFFETMESAIIRSYDTLLKIRKKAIFWQNNSEVTFNERQVKILNRLLDGFEGKLTTSKYAKICHTSQATALRDIQDLLERNILVKTESGGRSSGYEIK
jgi:Fic family protein